MTAPLQRLVPLPPGAGPAVSAPVRAEKDALDRAARAFAALLVEELLKASLASGAGTGLFPAGVAGETYRGTFVRSLAERIAAAPGFPLSAALAERLSPRRAP